MNPNFTFAGLKSSFFFRAVVLLTFLAGMGTNAMAQCRIEVTGCPIDQTVCATKSPLIQGQPDSAFVTWTDPNFTLVDCGNNVGGYSFVMLWELPESKLGQDCWDFNFVQRTGDKTLGIWKSNGVLPPHFTTPYLYFSGGAADMRLDLFGTISYQVDVYLIPEGGVQPGTPAATINYSGADLNNLVQKTFTVTPPQPGNYLVKYVFTTNESYNGQDVYVDFVGIDGLVSSNCAGGIDFIVTGPKPGYYAVGSHPLKYTATYTYLVGNTETTITKDCNFTITVNGVSASTSSVMDTECGKANGSFTLTATPSAGATQLQYSINDGAWTTFISPVNITELSGGAKSIKVRALFGATYCESLQTLNVNIGTSVDATPPVITCPTVAASYNTNPNLCTYSFTFTATAEDLCDPAPVIKYYLNYGQQNQTEITVWPYLFPKGTTRVTAVATDEDENSSTCFRDIVVVDAQNPTISCVGVQTRNTNTNVCTYTASGTEFNPTATGDNCPLGGSPLSYQLSGVTTTGVVVSNTLAGVVFNKGETTVTWTITDASGNTGTCNFKVTVNDMQNPTISCVGNQTRNTNTNVCTYTASGTEFNPTATNDNCPLGLTPLSYQLSGATTVGPVTASSLNGVVFNKGVTTVTWTIADASGNTGTCNFTVTVNDTQNPTVSCVGNQTRNTNSNVCTYTASGTEFNPTATNDNCPLGPTPLSYQLSDATTAGPVTASSLNGVVFNKGVTTVTWTITDASGNTGTCNFTVTVNDNQPPTITCPTPAASYNNDPGQCGRQINLPAQASDNCGQVSIAYAIGQTPITFPYFFPLGTTTVTATATDGSGLTESCNYNIVVVDNEPVTFNCTSLVVESSQGSCVGVNVPLTQPVLTDNCTLPQYTVDAVRSDGKLLTDLYPIGTTTVTWTARNAQNVVLATCATTVRVNEGSILANYLFASAGTGSYPYPAEETATGITSNATSSEPFNGTGSGAVETGDQAFKLNPGNDGALIMQPSSGENTRYFQFVVSGATLSQYGQFKVYFMAERNPQGAPLVTLRYSTDGVNYTDAGTMDVVTNQFNQKVFDLSAIAALNNYNLTTLYFRVYASGATSTSSAAATRLEIDNFQVFAKTRPPVATITAQTNVLCRGASTGSATAAGSLGFPPYTYSWNTNPVQTGATAINLAAGIYTVTVTDSKGCTGTAQVTITQPATAVSVTLVSQVNPNCLAPGAAAGSFTVAGAGGVPPYSYSRNDVDYSNTTGVFTGLVAGTYTVWARDANGCKSSRQVTITETADVTAPTITTCPAAKSATVTAQACNAAVPNVIGEVVATDACTPANQLVITQSPAAGTLLGVGSHTIVVSVRDLVGNVRTCNVTFTVIDNINPVIVTCPAPQSGFANNTCRAAVPNFTTGVVATDNCSSGNSLQITQSPTAGTLVPLGTTTVTITVRDASNNTVTCTTTFTVTDNTPPTITCPANITTPDDGCGIASIALGTPIANDNCTTVTVAGVRSDGKPLTDPYPLGNTTITWTATDGVGLTATCSQTVTVTKSPGTVLVNYTFVGLTGYPFNANETATGITSNVNTAEPFSPQSSGTSTGPLAFKQNIGTNEFLNMQPSDGENTRYFQFQISGENLKFYSQFKIYFQGSRQPQAADKINVAYSIDGVNYTFNGSLAIPLQREWYEALIDYSTIAALNGNNLSTLYIRLYVSGSTSTGGSDATRLEIDNFQVLAQGLGVVITCNSAITVNLTPPATCSAAVTLTTPAASSRCGTVTVTGSRSDGQPLNDPFPIGTTTITWTGVDPGGNSASCTQTVTVIGLVDAVDDMFVINTGVAGILGNVLSNDQLECKPATPANVVITVTEASADSRVTLNPATGNVEGADGTPIGTYTIKYRICEIGGSPARCDEATVTVVVDDRPLPVTGLRLFGNRAGNDVNLNWVTVAEQNSSHFILERSLDGLTFAPIPVGNRVAAAGNSNNQRNYNQVDRNMVATVVYYRVRLYDNDGSFRMSNVVAVRMAQGREFRVYPNPVVNMVTIEFAENGKYRVDLLSASGQLIQVNNEVFVTNSMNTITVPRNNIPAGMYELRVTNSSTGKVSTVKLIYQPR